MGKTKTLKYLGKISTINLDYYIGYVSNNALVTQKVGIKLKQIKITNYHRTYES